MHCSLFRHHLLRSCALHSFIQSSHFEKLSIADLFRLDLLRSCALQIHLDLIFWEAVHCRFIQTWPFWEAVHCTVLLRLPFEKLCIAQIYSDFTFWESVHCTDLFRLYFLRSCALHRFIQTLPFEKLCIADLFRLYQSPYSEIVYWYMIMKWPLSLCTV